ncbi:MAG: PD-(D/E)XK nuclease family protein [Chloroflexi bacterium]|nr:PD-(D/E)XK nuclease family protein [Chloroflexota bacterium]
MKRTRTTDLKDWLEREEVNLALEEAEMADLQSGDLRDARRGGYYWLDGQPYVSVTEVLGVLDKPGLRYWFGQEVWRAMAANPSLSEREALAAPFQIVDDARARGQTIHSIVEAYKHTRKYIEGIPEKYRGYAQAFYRWTQDHGVEIVEHERTVVSRKYRYAGTLDLLVRLNGGELPIIVDCKTGKDIYQEAFLQLAAYRQALKEGGQEVAGTAVLLLQEDGSFKYQFSERDCFRPFFACLVLYEWLHAEEIAKLKEYAKKGGK